MAITIPPRTPAWHDDPNPVGPPQNSATAVQVDAATMLDLEARINVALGQLEAAANDAIALAIIGV